MISLSGYDGGKICSHRTHRWERAAGRASGPPVPGVPDHLPHHHGGQPWTDFSHLEGPHLHTPMYSFLGSLAFADACSSSSVIPKMLMNFLSKDHISFIECITQFYIFAFSAATENFLLVVMAYDHYAAILNPLLYPVVMSNRLCTCLISASYAIGFLHPTIHVGLLFRLTFCRSNIIHHYFCEILPLFAISCTDPSINALVLFISASFIQAFTFITIIVSYTFVLFATLKKKSEKGTSTAFSTCNAHLLSVFLFYGTLFFMYVHPGSGPDQY